MNIFTRYLPLTLLLCVLGLAPAGAQQFGVKAFRPLPNDISAYISPVRDLNGEACALLKVVGDKDFVFSTPLGVVKQQQEVGEIWVYVPRGTVQITLKHPRWGVLRDYRFPRPLESRLTYELVVNPPSALVWEQLEMPPLPTQPAPLAGEAAPTPQALEGRPVRWKRPRERWHALLMANVGIEASPAVGLRAAVMRRHGAYVLLQTDLHAQPGTQGDCARNGQTADGGTPYYTGTTRQARRYLMAGAIHRVAGEFCLYEGIGYGRRTVAWETVEGTLLRNTHYSAEGISAEAGIVYRWPRIAISAGAMTIAGKHWEATVGVGWHF